MPLGPRSLTSLNSAAMPSFAFSAAAPTAGDFGKPAAAAAASKPVFTFAAGGSAAKENAGASFTFAAGGGAAKQGAAAAPPAQGFTARQSKAEGMFVFGAVQAAKADAAPARAKEDRLSQVRFPGHVGRFATPMVAC